MPRKGGSKHHRGSPIYKNEFSYVVDDKEYQGASYAKGRKLQAGVTAAVEYLPGKPGVARIHGMRTEVFGPEVLFVSIFPLIGLVSLSFGLIKGVKACSLLAYGIQSSGKLMFKESTNMRVSGRTVYKFSFCFKTAGGEVCTAAAKSYTGVFENKAEEQVLYDPSQPQRALLLASLPGSPQLGEDGHLICPRPASSLWCSVIPLVAILGHGYWMLRLLIH